MVNHPFGVVVNFKTPDFPSPLRYLFGILFTLQVSSYRGLGNQGNQIISIAFHGLLFGTLHSYVPFSFLVPHK